MIVFELTLIVTVKLKKIRLNFDFIIIINNTLNNFYELHLECVWKCYP